VEDVGFSNMGVIPMGGDRVFIRGRNNENIWEVYNLAKDFFGMFLSDVQKWSSKKLRYERGVWVRVYGTPAHAWKINFFKLCVSECGKFVRVDDCTLDRGQIDYARVLITTTSLEVLNLTTDVLVDGTTFSIKLVEEWGCNLGEDAFLSEDNSEQNLFKDEGFDNFDGHDIEGEGGEVEAILDDLCNDWKEHEASALIISSVKHDTNSVELKHLNVAAVHLTQQPLQVTTSCSCEAVTKAQGKSVPHNSNAGSSMAGSTIKSISSSRATKKNNSSMKHGTKVVMCEAADPNILSLKHDIKKKHDTKVVTCEAADPNILSLKHDTKNVALEDLKVLAVPLDQQPLRVTVPCIFNASRNIQRQSVPPNLNVGSSMDGSIKKFIPSSGATNKNKGGGFKYSSRNLKRVARMPAKDRREILKILKKRAKEQKARFIANSSRKKGIVTSNSSKIDSTTSLSSVNKDLEHWVLL